MDSLSWDATYAIATELKRKFPLADLSNLSLMQLYKMILELPEFSDDPSLATDDILKEIYRIWYEESIHDNERT